METMMEENMSAQERKLVSQKYFIYRINEYFKNNHHILQEKRCDSVRAMLCDCLDIHDEINKNKGDVTKLEIALNYLYKAIIYRIEENPLSKHPFLLKDFNNLIKKLKEEKRNHVAEFSFISSLLKKIKNKDIITFHIDIIKDVDKLSFSQVDELLDSLVNELLYEGYSLSFLDEWCVENILKAPEIKDLNERNLAILLGKFQEVSCKSNKYSVILNSWLPKELFEELSTKTTIKINDFVFSEFNKNEMVIKEHNKHFINSENYYFLKTETIACDKYKAIEKSKNTLDEFLRMYKFFEGNSRTNQMICLHVLVKQEGENANWEKPRPANTDYSRIIKEMDSREKEDIRDFITLRDELRNKNIQSNDLLVIQRALDLIGTSSEQSMENRLLNIWSALEYLLTFYSRTSIIEKARQIIPKVICLYYIKDKMNKLWEKILLFKEKHTQINAIYTICVDTEKEDKYDKINFPSYLANTEKAQESYNALSFNITMQREVAELNFLLNKAGGTKTIITNTYTKIEHDLNRIYRIRNKLVHSGSNLNTNIDIYTGRIYRYVNCLLGTLIYHIKRSPELTITEILYSIDSTYEWYIEFLKEHENQPVANIRELSSPPYLYL
ncbi:MULTISPECIES: hypothetical protein [unclassified Paenibacillus]|uniref:hypothetical protein n=1 Tax=unclassified Paenibacillus TaxID=185978 RepID=UPI002405EE5D|nr:MULTISPECIES: hypothetical protein [unclassified Paenibacillus]MDF9840749.1 hypothetical protein [Paenibacillus sp. PastF-2]MDF9847332.1 hypothetical protein [Paenibacillus sp. PastM-2]MDF9854090.1 hypothetical protein [Paenibacillus sp. PastF-1]MDH6479363.1 hypothetical protein [Paenibacillus sp. PastH-2]MDH6506904.1 hypothetical protein [Paenibacillus sp. PastM-3]